MPLGRYVKEFPPPSRLHPFESALLDLTVGPGTYERVLARVDAVRKSTVQVSSAHRSYTHGPWLDGRLRIPVLAATQLQHLGLAICLALPDRVEAGGRVADFGRVRRG